MIRRAPGFALALLVLAGPALAQYAPAPQAQPQPQPPSKPPALQQPKPQAAPANAPARIDAARQLYQSGKLFESVQELDAAIDAIHAQLGQKFAVTLPAAPQGWAAEPPDPQRLALLGSGVPAARDYRQANGQSRMNARIVLDADAVRAMAPLFGPQMPQGMPQTVRRAKIGQEDAVVAYDPQARGGEVSVLVGGKILLQVEGSNVASADPMIATMRNWNIAELKRLAGL